MRTIGGIFGRSAWGPLWEHLEKSNECIDTLFLCVKEFIAGNAKKTKELSKKVVSLEKEADIIKENIRMRLSRSIFSSIERSDVVAWLRQQDGIADACEDTAKLISLRKTKVVKELEKPLTVMMARVAEMGDDLIKAVKIFGEGKAEEFSKADIKNITDFVDDTQKGKDEVDNLQIEFLEILFKSEKKMDPVSVFFLKDISDKIARIADRIENVGDIIRHLLNK